MSSLSSSSGLKSDSDLDKNASVANNVVTTSSTTTVKNSSTSTSAKEDLVRQKVQHWWARKLPKEPATTSFDSLENANFGKDTASMLLLDQPGILGGPTGVAFQVVVICLIFSQVSLEHFAHVCVNEPPT